jgi:hypothetical protein
MQRQLNLDRVAVDGFVVRRRSATLRFGPGDRPGTRRSPWWAYLACDQIPGSYSVGRPILLDATVVSGRQIHADARIVERDDDDFGTTLILVGVSPISDDVLRTP